MKNTKSSTIKPLKSRVRLAGLRRPTYDHNGNVTHLLRAPLPGTTDAYGNPSPAQARVEATYEYDAFGGVIRATGPASAWNPFTFSTKYLDRETGWSYYGYRYYDALRGRWPSRDPIGEKGGLNLYEMVGNRPLDFTDILGLDAAWEPPTEINDETGQPEVYPGRSDPKTMLVGCCGGSSFYTHSHCCVGNKIVEKVRQSVLMGYGDDWKKCAGGEANYWVALGGGVVGAAGAVLSRVQAPQARIAGRMLSVIGEAVTTIGLIDLLRQTSKCRLLVCPN